MQSSLLYSITILFFLATIIFAAPAGEDQSDSHNYIKFIKPNKYTVWKVGEKVSIELLTAGVKESKVLKVFQPMCP
ncbi:hypothetical protein BKA69DRAFT_1072653 [Paraphysoderma sedebokerense]|nr:hypothetical protein BKA69DRAFT_1072653 [Paraphysoderma sedebokerense]